MSEFYIRKITYYRFNVDKNEGESVIGYGTIIGCDLMVQLGILDDFKHHVLKWDGDKVPMKESRGMIGKTDLTSHDIHEVVTQTAEPVPTREATERTVTVFYSTYAKAEL